MKQDQQQAFLRALREAAPYLGLGASLAGAVLLGLGAGAVFDAALGSTPFGLIGGGLLGIVTAGFYLSRVAGGRP